MIPFQAELNEKSVQSSGEGWIKGRFQTFGLMVLAVFLVCSFVSIVIPASIFLAFDKVPESQVNKERCTCDCWDGLNKGSYGRSVGATEYRSVFWNMERETYYLLMVVGFYLVLAVEGVRQLLSWIINRQPINFLMFVGTAFTIYPNMYGFYMTFNYVNDRIWHFWFTQLFFTITELTCACCCFLLMPGGETTPKKATVFLSWTAVTISVIHLIQSLIDQGIANLSVGAKHQVSRDLGFVICDLGVLAVCTIHLARFYQREGLHAAFFRQHAWEATKYGFLLWVGFQFIP